MKTISNWLVTAWTWLDGKKSKIALVYWTVITPCLPIIWPNNTVPSSINKIYLVIGIVLSAVGLGHASVKAYQEKRAAKTALSKTSVQP